MVGDPGPWSGITQLLLLRRRDTGVYLPFAMLFAFQGTSLGVAALAEASDPSALKFVAIALCVLLADFGFKAMIAVYIYLIIRRLMAYRTRLKDVFASTENRELTWIWVILISMTFYLCVSVAFTASVLAGLFAQETYDAWLQTLNDIAMLVLFWAIGVWGLRQRPGLTRQPVISPPEPDHPEPRKYEKSALDNDRLQRIARKVEAAMAKDLLYRDPNLSLSSLPAHTSHRLTACQWLPPLVAVYARARALLCQSASAMAASIIKQISAFEMSPMAP